MAGCFSFLKKPAPPARELVEKPPSARRSHSTKSSNWADGDYTPRLPEAHEHYEPCFQCSDALSRMTLDKMGMDADLPAYSEREPFSKDVSEAGRAPSGIGGIDGGMVRAAADCQRLGLCHPTLKCPQLAHTFSPFHCAISPPPPLLALLC